jgi:hypothetical protein
MQKLDYTESINQIKEKLKSQSIVDFIDKLSLTQPVKTNELTPLIIESKSNFDKIDHESNEFEILKALAGRVLYEQTYIGNLINQTLQASISNQLKVHLFTHSTLSQFYNFHYSILQCAALANLVLFEDEKLTSLNSDEIIVFRILVGEGNLELRSYGKILKLLEDLIDILQNVYVEESADKPSVVLLDSGSDSNIGVKSSVQIGTALFQIFKEIWDWVLNRKYYKNKLRTDAFLENLNVFNAIKESERSGSIDAATAKTYRETILRKTEDLLELKVLPKKLIESQTYISNQKVLSEYSEIKMLGEGKI